MAIEVDDTSSSNDQTNAAAAQPAKETANAAPSQQSAPTPAPTKSAAPAPTAAPKQTTNNTSTQGTRMNTPLSSRVNYGMSRAATSQAMRAIVEVIDKIAEGEQEQPVKFSFFSLDGEKEGLLISSLVVVATLKNPGSDTKFAAHHTLLLAATARGATAVEQSFGQIKFERLVVPADAYDATLRARVAEVVKGQFPDYALIDADATVVPADLDLRSEEAVRNIIANATTASSTLLASVVASDGWTINDDVRSMTFQNEMKSSYGHFVDLTAQPVRGDVVLEMSVLTGRNQNQNQQTGGEFQYNNSQAKEMITQLTGYIDLVSTPPVQTNAFGFGGLTQGMAARAEELKIYTPRLVITNVDAPGEGCELPVILQGLGTAQALQNDQRWVAALIQQHKNGASHAEGGVNIRDLSAIGLEAPVLAPPAYMGGEMPKAGRLPLNSANVNDAMLAAAIQTYFHSDLLISMDVPECGASSWISSPFAAAARGDQNAIRDIFEAADMLTEGKFTPIYKSVCGGQMKNPVFNDNMYVNTGYYFSAAGKRDIRDIDYIAILNATGDSELDTINDWANLQANAEVDPMFRLTETRRIQQRLFESLTITGRAVRITFNPAFVYAVAAAVAEAGLVYETKVGMAAPQGTARMVPQYMRGLPTGLGNAGSFVASGMRRPQAGGFAASSFGRYAHNRGASNASGAGNY